MENKFDFAMKVTEPYTLLKRVKQSIQIHFRIIGAIKLINTVFQLNSPSTSQSLNQLLVDKLKVHEICVPYLVLSLRLVYICK